MSSIEEMLEDTLPLTEITYAQFLGAIVLLVAGLFLTNLVVRFSHRGLTKLRLSPLIVDFMSTLLGTLLKVFVIITFAGAIGFSMGPAILGLSAVIGLILGFGMQDTFNNIAAGMWIASLRPIDKNEVVEIDGRKGKVRAIGLMATELITPDNRFITIPNSQVWGSSIENFSRMPTRRVDVNVGVAYGTEIEKAVQVAHRVMKAHEMVLEDPAPTVVTTELADSSVNLQLRPWCVTDDYWTVLNDMQNAIYKAFNEEGISIPFPQMDLHLTKE